jgi:hypothetical protein
LDVDHAPPIVPILFIVVIAIAMTIIAILNAKANRQRTQALAAWAQARAWSFDPGPDSGLESQFPQFELFHRGYDRRASNTIRGVATVSNRPFPITCGDYRYTVSHGKSSTTYRLSYIILTLPFPNVPGLDIRRENLLDKFAGALGFQDINFESERFSREFFVKCPDKKFAYDVITPKTMDFLLGSDPPPIHISGGQVCLVDAPARLWQPIDFDHHIAWADFFFGLWPDFLAGSARNPA